MAVFLAQNLDLPRLNDIGARALFAFAENPGAFAIHLAFENFEAVFHAPS